MGFGVTGSGIGVYVPESRIPNPESRNLKQCGAEQQSLSNTEILWGRLTSRRRRSRVEKLKREVEVSGYRVRGIRCGVQSVELRV